MFIFWNSHEQTIHLLVIDIEVPHMLPHSISLKFGNSNALVLDVSSCESQMLNSCCIWKRSVHTQCFNHFTNNWTQLMHWLWNTKTCPNKFQKQCRNKPRKPTLHVHHHTKIFVQCYVVFVHFTLHYATKYHLIVLSMFQSVLFLLVLCNALCFLSIWICTPFSIAVSLGSSVLWSQYYFCFVLHGALYEQKTIRVTSLVPT